MRISMSTLGVTAACAGLSLLSPLAASAETVTINAYQSGYARDTGLVQNADGNYFTGLLDGEEYRGYFVFDLSALAGLEVTSATLRLDTDDFQSTDPDETVNFYLYTGNIATLTSAPTISPAAYTDLGDGLVLGTQVYSEALQDVVLDITLTADAIAALNNAIGSGSFAFGATMVTLSGNSADQWVYGQSDDLGSVRQLRLETQPVPEPGVAGLLCAAGITWLVFRRRK